MLVLARKIQEKVVVSVAGYTINVRVIDVRGKSVRLGVDAPREVVVHREEVWDRIASEHYGDHELPVAS